MLQSRRKFWRKLNYQWHLWLGLWTAIFVVVVSLTGIVLNHKIAFGMMSDPKHKLGSALTSALPLERLVTLSMQAFNRPLA